MQLPSRLEDSLARRIPRPYEIVTLVIAAIRSAHKLAIKAGRQRERERRTIMNLKRLNRGSKGETTSVERIDGGSKKEMDENTRWIF